MSDDSARMKRERITIDSMIRLYCRLKHGQGSGLCPECQDLQDYTHLRLERCPFKVDKPTCAQCTVHCYKADRREQIRAVMRFAGPRMLIYHPVLAIRHLWDGRNLPLPFPLGKGKRKGPSL
jgi:hypothetical protein